MPVAVDSETSAVTALLSSLPPGSQGVDSLDRMRAWLDQHADEFVAVLGPHLDLDDCLKVCEDLRTARPTVSVVLVRDKLDTTVLANAMKAGARDVVDVEDTASLTSAVERARELWTALRGPSGAQQLGRVITVFSPKGGVGKTTMAVNLALALTERGARRVCLVDLDLAFGDVAIALQLFPSHTIADAVPLGEADLDFSGLQALLTPHSAGLTTLVAPVEPGAAETIPASLVTRIIEILRENFDFVVIDTPPAFDDQVLAAFDLSDAVVLLATLDIPALKNLKLTLETLDLLNYPRERWKIVLNRSDSKVGLAISEVEKTLRTPITAQVPSSRDVPASINRGVPIILDDPKHPVSAAIREFAERELASGHAHHTERVPETLRNDRRGFLRRRART